MKPRNRREKKEALDIDITSLLDILVIMLVFLLKSYNASSLTVEVAKELELSNSYSDTLGEQAIIVQLNKEQKLFINNNFLIDMSPGKGEIPELLQKLKELKEAEPKVVAEEPVTSIQDTPKDPKKKRRPINLVFDKKTPYINIQRVMHTASVAGHDQYKFIVQGEGQ
jgi:biopolymer transport protein ExbD